MSQVHNTTADYLKDFMQPTAEKQVKEPEVIEAPSSAKKMVEIEPAPAPAAVDPEPVEPAKRQSMSADTQSEIYLGAFDTAQTLVLNALNERKKRRRLGDDKERAEEIYEMVTSRAASLNTFTDEEKKMYLRIKPLMEVTETIPFSDDEYDKAKRPLAKIIEESGMDMPPNMAFMMVAVEIMAPRLVDVFFE